MEIFERLSHQEEADSHSWKAQLDQKEKIVGHNINVLAAVEE